MGNGKHCVELTRLFTNVLDVDAFELMNVDDEDTMDLREMLVPGLKKEARSPLFVGPSQCDGELLIRLPFNFPKALSWEFTHLRVRASHPPAPGCVAPRSVALLANTPSATFSDFEDSNAVEVALTRVGDGEFIIPLEQYRIKGTFRR